MLRVIHTCTSALLSLAFVGSATGCILDPEPDPCVEPIGTRSCLVRVVDSLGGDQSLANVEMRVQVSMFGLGGAFAGVWWTTPLTRAEFTYPIHEPVRVVGWGNVAQQSQTALGQADVLSSGSVALQTLPDGSHRSPDDLFYGTRIINATTRMADDELWIRRSVSALSIRTINAPHAESDEYSYQVKGTSTELDYNGLPTNRDAVYLPKAAWEGGGGFVAKSFRTFATQASERITIELYRGRTLIYSTHSDAQGRPLIALNDKMLYVTIDLGSDLGTDAGVGVSFVSSEWNPHDIEQQF